MVRKLFTTMVFALFVFCLAATAGQKERYLLHLMPNGKQEAIPLQHGEKAWEVIARREGATAHFLSKTDGLKDNLFNTPDTGVSLNTNFGYNHQDVAFEWFVPQTDGVVKEVHWDHLLTGDIHQGKLRAWNANPALLTLPATAVDATGNMGWYIQAADGDGKVTPYKADADAPKTFHAGVGATAGINFDPLGTESMGTPGGVTLTLHDSVWNSYVLSTATTDSFKIFKGQPFGFTLQNSSPAGGLNGRMELLSAASTAPPYHSMKFYEIERNAGNGDPGWWIRGYEWGIYVVVEYTGDRAPKFVKNAQLFTTLNTGTRTATATITDDNPGGGAAGVQSAAIFWKKGKLGTYASVPMTLTATANVYSGTLPGSSATDTMYYYYSATDVNGNTSTTPVTPYSYTIFTPAHTTLALYNFRAAVAGATREQVVATYMSGAGAYDIWDVGKYGIIDIPQLFPSYNTIIEMTGDGPNAKNFTDQIGPWLATGTPASPKLYFLTDQDHGWISNYADTVFADTNVHAKYFGVKKLGPQDYPYTISGSGATYVGYPWELKIASVDSVTAFITAFAQANAEKFYYHPYYEWGGLAGANFYNWMDCITPTTGAKVLFRDSTKWKTKTNLDTLSGRVVGVRNQAANKSWATVYCGFDILATDFRSDTSKAPTDDLAYAFILDAGNPIKKFMANPFVATGVQTVNNNVPAVFALQQNYPNPFNPTTKIDYSIARTSHVTLTIYNIMGQEVQTLVNQEMAAGTYSVPFDASRLASGVYLYTLNAGSFVKTQKMVLLK